MSNKKCKITSVSELIKSKKTETSVSELIKSNKKCKVETPKTSVAELMKPKKNYSYVCNCVRCEGKEVDYRTQEKHTYDENLWKSRPKDSRKNQENAIMTRKQPKSSINNSDVNAETKLNISKKRKRDSHHDASSPNPDSSHPGSSSQSNIEEENIHTLFSSKPSCFRIPAPTIDESNDEINYFDENDDTYNMEDNDDADNMDEREDNMEEGDDDMEEGDDDDYIKNFFTYPEIDSDEVFVMESLNDSIETEIILWAFKFQQRFRLPDIALEALIKFLHIVLTRLNELQFKNFPNSLYIAKKMLNIFQPKMQLAVCNNCHKLHNVKNIVEYKEEGKAAIANCLHEEFPNNPVSSHRNKCNNPLSILKKRKDGAIAVPRMLYPKPSIRQQLSMLYQ